MHFQCNYCNVPPFLGPSSTGVLNHLREKHPKKCPELLKSKEDGKVDKQVLDSNNNIRQIFNHTIFRGQKNE